MKQDAGQLASEGWFRGWLSNQKSKVIHSRVHSRDHIRGGAGQGGRFYRMSPALGKGDTAHRGKGYHETKGKEKKERFTKTDPLRKWSPHTDRLRHKFSAGLLFPPHILLHSRSEYGADCLNCCGESRARHTKAGLVRCLPQNFRDE